MDLSVDAMGLKGRQTAENPFGVFSKEVTPLQSIE
jgi:hypothetical protein